MPITQQRMIATIRAGQDYKQALDTILESILHLNNEVVLGRVSLQEAWINLVPSARAHFLLAHPTESEITLAIEARHFKQHGQANMRKAAAMRHSRGQYDSEPRPTAPKTLVPQHTLPKSLVRQLATPQVEEYTPRELSPEAKAEVERIMAAMPPDLNAGSPSNVLTPEEALRREAEEAQRPDFEGELEL